MASTFVIKQITMVERIRTLLEVRQLTPTQFADAIGIARPIVSHILSGRNKPSLEVVQRILAAMPDLSMPWLLNGTGPMLAAGLATPAGAPVSVAIVSDKESVTAELPAAPAPPPAGAPRVRRAAPVPVATLPRPVGAVAIPGPRRFTSLSLTARPAPVAPESVPSAVSMITAVPGLPAPAAPAADAPPIPAPDSTLAPVAAAASKTATALFAGTEKPIRRIVIFYRDGSFADYQSE